MPAADDPTTDLTGTVEPGLGDSALSDLLQPLIDTIRVAISSCIGMSTTLVTNGHAVTVTVMDDRIRSGVITASLRVPLTALRDVEAGSALTFYATTPGAFVDLAADISYTLNLDSDTLLMDQHLVRPIPVRGVTGAAELSHVNQAIGILIDRGRTLEHARTYLHHLARHDDITVLTAARHIIDATIAAATNNRPP